MASIRVVLVEPKNEGNVGAVARAMKNFGVTDLALVRACVLGSEARQRAMHGLDVLEGARLVNDLETAIDGMDLVVGTSAVDTTSEKRFARISMSPRELAAKVSAMEGGLAVLFGREDFGLLDDELSRCDVLVKVAASEAYPILNLSHAAAILLYELYGGAAIRKGIRPASGLEKEKVHEAFDALLDATDYPSYKRARTKMMFRRLLGRAVPSKWEFHALMGVFGRATKRIRRLEEGR